MTAFSLIFTLALLVFIVSYFYCVKRAKKYKPYSRFPKSQPYIINIKSNNPNRVHQFKLLDLINTFFNSSESIARNDIIISSGIHTITLKELFYVFFLKTHLIESIYIHSTTPNQILQPITVVGKSANGNIYSKTLMPKKYAKYPKSCASISIPNGYYTLDLFTEIYINVLPKSEFKLYLYPYISEKQTDRVFYLKIYKIINRIKRFFNLKFKIL